MTQCIKCKKEFLPIVKSRIICDTCIDLRDNPPPPEPKKKVPKRKYKKIRKPYNRRTICLVCSRPFRVRQLNGKTYFVRVDSKYCTKMCRDFDRFNNKNYKKRYNISSAIKTPITCKLCNKSVIRLAQHLRVAHDINMIQYINM